MTKQRVWIGMVLVGLLLVPARAFAQDNHCPAIVQDALAAVDTACVDTGSNQVCYGNIILEAEPQPGIQDFALDEPGDLADVGGVQTLRLSAMDTAAATWGIALMKLQANLPDTLPGQSVTFLLFGDVEIHNAVESAPESVLLAVTATNNINVRGGPSTNYAVVGSLTNGQTVMADGQNEAGDWLRIQLEDSQIGWVYVPLMTVEGDMTTLPVLAADDMEPVVTEPEFGPMQSFYFRSGISDAPCTEAPNSGLLVQTPEGAGEVSFLVDEVHIQLGSTIFMQAQANGELTINVIEGQARVSAFDVTRTVPAGARVRVPLDGNLAVSGPPSEVEPFDADDVQALPVGMVAFDQEVVIPEPLIEDALEELANAAPLTVSAAPLMDGTWQVVATLQCSYPTALAESTDTADIHFEVTDEGLLSSDTVILLLEKDLFFGMATLGMIPLDEFDESGGYTMDGVNGGVITYTIESPSQVVVTTSTSDCTETLTYTLISPAGG